MKIKIPNHVIDILNLLKENGYEAYVVGGAIRDSLLLKAVHDYDIATNATIDELKEVFKDYPQINKNGLKHGTVTIRYQDDNIEITSYRYDEGEEKTILTDLLHRDLNINAIAFDLSNIIDPRNGVEDISNRIISMGNNPEKTIQEDPLRMLRAIRFHAELKYEIDVKTKEAIIRNSELIERVSKERITSEFKRIIVADDIKDILWAYQDLLKSIFPIFNEIIGYNQMSVWHKNDLFVHTLNVMEGVKGDVLLRLAALFHDIGKPKAMSYENTSKGLIRHYYGHPLFSKELTYEIMSEYRYSNIERDTICFLIEYHDHEISPTNKSVKKILNKISDIPNIKRSELELLSDLLDLQISDHNDHAIVKSIDKETIINIAVEIINTRDAFNVKDLDINGNDLQKYGIYGKEIGQTLNTLLELVMDNKIPNKRKDLLEYVKKERNKD